MKLHSMKPVWSGDDTVYRNLRPLEPENWGSATLEKQRRGEPLEMVWAGDSDGKPIGDFIVFPGAGLATNTNLLARLKRFAPSNVVNPIKVNGVDSPFSLLNVSNHQPGDKQIPHIFMMFKQYKAMLVTQLFKEEWQRLGLTGAEFSELAELPDADFITVQN